MFSVSLGECQVSSTAFLVYFNLGALQPQWKKRQVILVSNSLSPIWKPAQIHNWSVLNKQTHCPTEYGRQDYKKYVKVTQQRLNILLKFLAICYFPAQTIDMIF